MRPAQANNLTLLKTGNYLDFFRPITEMTKRFVSKFQITVGEIRLCVEM